MACEVLESGNTSTEFRIMLYCKIIFIRWTFNFVSFVDSAINGNVETNKIFIYFSYIVYFFEIHEIKCPCSLDYLPLTTIVTCKV